jgi:hypothetical protein
MGKGNHVGIVSCLRGANPSKTQDLYDRRTSEAAFILIPTNSQLRIIYREIED